MDIFMKHDFTIDKITFASLVKAGTASRIHKNRKNHGLAFFPDGELTFLFDDGTELNVSKNTIVYLPKNSNYVVEKQSPSDCYAINFDMPYSMHFSPFKFKVKNTTEYLDAFKTSDKIWTRKKTAYMTKVKSELYNIIYLMQSEYELPYQKIGYNKIKPAVDYISSHYNTQNISISLLANLCDMSPANLRNCFLKEFGVSTLKYINNLKITRAKELLTTDMYSVSEVCYLSGFQDESYFSREFKKATGVSPSKYAYLG
ncbi:MAG: AraC family transcriptional regulator [Firmicutes bacterium]|nr:AraC family transcriptional regulator [Bacillota bacterium]